MYVDCDHSDPGGGTGFETRCEPVRRVDREKQMGRCGPFASYFITQCLGRVIVNCAS